MSQLKIKVEHINPFVTSTIETFAKMVGVEAKPGKLMVKKGNKEDYDISGIIGISGGAKGMVALSFPKSTALRVTNKFVGTAYEEMNADTIDAIGELANIVVGYAKKGLSEFNVLISLPSVITGTNHQIMEPKDVFSFIVPFETPLGGFHLLVSLKAAE
ncbi:MAG: chemotaxis protein [Fibrobacteres bacterium]|nr:chemotaxis protein [Fibrobacterota bacterium]